MDFKNYQAEAAKTDQRPGDSRESISIPLLGLAGEVGSLQSGYKKYLRDGASYKLYHEHIAEELGDILWYVANIATKFSFDLEEIAQANLRKTQDRWLRDQHNQPSLGFISDFYDEQFPEHEQIPRNFRVQFVELDGNNGPTIRLSRQGVPVGDDLTDNAYSDDGYRFHDIFHFSYAAILGWSPVTRKILKCKRRSDPKIDEVEDGGRASVIEEAIAAYVYEYASNNNFLTGVKSIDYLILKTIKDLTKDFEVNTRSYAEWEKAIFEGYRIFKMLRENRGGTVTVDLVKRHLKYRKR